MTFPPNPHLGERSGNWRWNGERWICAPADFPQPDPGPSFIEVTIDGVTALYGQFSLMCSLVLTPGDWDVWGNVNQEANPAFIAKNYQGLIWNAPSLAVGVPPASQITTNRNGRTAFVQQSPGEIQAFGFGLGPMRWLVSVPTPVYLLLYCNPGTEVTSTSYIAGGYLAARRQALWSSRSATPAFEVYRGPRPAVNVPGGVGIEPVQTDEEFFGQ